MNVKQSTLALAIVAALPFAAQAAPKVAFTAPLAGSTISGDIYQNSRCEVKGSSDIRRVVFWLDGNVQLNTEGSVPWNCNVNTTKYNDGAHKLKAVAYDAQGASTATEISVNFGNGTGGTTTPLPTGGTTTPPAGYAGTPYTGTPIAVPGTFEAENFDKGGSNVAYKDLSSGNAGGQYRTADSVDIIASSDAAGGGYTVNYFETGEWLAYTINVPSDGNYDISIRAANKNMTGAAFHAEIDGVDVTGKVAVPSTGDWTSFQWVGRSAVPLKAGKRILKIVSDQQYFNVNAVSVLAPGTTTPTTPTNQAPSVSFKAPTAGAELSGSVNSTTCEVNATDDVKVARVEFALGATALAPKTVAPWQCNIDTTKFADGGYQLKAVAYDDQGKSNNTEVAVSVKNGTVSTPPASGTTPASLLFWSGFEGAVTPGTPFDCYGNGCWQEIIGTDSTTGFTWPPKVANSSGRFQLLTNSGSQPSPTSVYNYMRNEIQTVTGPKGSSTRALYSKIDQSGCCGTDPQGGGSTQNPYLLFPTSDLKDFYVSFWIKLQADLAQKLHEGDAWRPMFEFKTTDTDYRLTIGVLAYNGATPYWEVKTDSYAPTRQTFWAVTTRDQLAVPGDKWMKLEIFWHRSSGPDGRVWVAVDGKTIADKSGPTMGPNKSPINRIMLTQLYSGSPYPIYQWVDDVQIWSTFPTVSSGDAWYNPPYAPH